MNQYIEAKLPYDNIIRKFILTENIKINYLDNVIVSYNGNYYLVNVISNKIKETEENIENNFIRQATQEDLNKNINNKTLAESNKKNIINLIKNHKLEMKIIQIVYSFDNKKMLLIYTSDNRVDFRELVKELVKKYKMKIELKQIGVRDKSKLIGGYGICGQTLCCKRFLNNFDSINISLAKKQNITLNPNKINGVCGRLMCCLKYENDK